MKKETLFEILIVLIVTIVLCLIPLMTTTTKPPPTVPVQSVGNVSGASISANQSQLQSTLSLPANVPGLAVYVFVATHSSGTPVAYTGLTDSNNNTYTKQASGTDLFGFTDFLNWALFRADQSTNFGPLTNTTTMILTAGFASNTVDLSIMSVVAFSQTSVNSLFASEQVLDFSGSSSAASSTLPGVAGGFLLAHTLALPATGQNLTIASPPGAAVIGAEFAADNGTVQYTCLPFGKGNLSPNTVTATANLTPASSWLISTCVVN